MLLPRGHALFSNHKFTTPVLFAGGFNSDFKLARTYSWNFSAEHQLVGDFVLRGAYVGSQASHLQIVVQRNPGIFANAGRRTLYPQFQSIRARRTIGSCATSIPRLSAPTLLAHSATAGVISCSRLTPTTGILGFRRTGASRSDTACSSDGRCSTRSIRQASDCPIRRRRVPRSEELPAAGQFRPA
jgi:hypothetical protein